MNELSSPQKVAIIGGGIAGLTCAYLLHRHGAGRFDIRLFEADARLGGHTATIDVRHGGRDYHLDTGFIVYNDWTYPNFIRLLDELGVASQATDMSFSVSCGDSGLEYSGSNLNTLFAQRQNLLRLEFWLMLRNILRFNRQAIADLEAGTLAVDATLGQYLSSNNYRGLFASHYLVPMCAAIWSASTAEVMEFPLVFFVQFFKNHGLLSVSDRPQWRVIKGCSRNYVAPLTQRFADKIVLNSTIRSVRRLPDGVQLLMQDGAVEQFDQVVFACHSDQALALLESPSEAERAVLGAIPYKSNDVVLHTDDKLLPRNRRVWAAWNYLLAQDNPDQAVLTYSMNILQGIRSDTEFCVTLNATDRIDPAKILGTYHYSHPSFSLDSLAAQQRWADINGVARTWYCGAYWANGFHEDGVASALRVAENLGVSW